MFPVINLQVRKVSLHLTICKNVLTSTQAVYHYHYDNQTLIVHRFKITLDKSISGHNDRFIT